MPLFTMRLNRVWDIRREVQAGKEITVFGVEADTDTGIIKKHPITVPGRPDIQQGAIVSVFLDMPNDWNNVLGWANHGTGEISIDSIDYHKGSILRCAVLIFTLLFWRFPDWLHTIIFLSLIFLILSSQKKIRKLHRTRQALQGACSSRQDGAINTAHS
ncbi:hypothetical protein [Undibacterium sp. Tian12W]|uniref:hypothetical protein n=1 Tax=Undibacterium sp. Tian12W TaxID=3413054 RepID=UPI003BF035F5